MIPSPCLNTGYIICHFHIWFLVLGKAILQGFQKLGTCFNPNSNILSFLLWVAMCTAQGQVHTSGARTRTHPHTLWALSDRRPDACQWHTESRRSPLHPHQPCWLSGFQSACHRRCLCSSQGSLHIYTLPGQRKGVIITKKLMQTAPTFQLLLKKD